MRQLKHHEQKLLKKVDFLQWKKEDTMREMKVIRRYFLQQREDYHKLVKFICNRSLYIYNINQID